MERINGVRPELGRQAVKRLTVVIATTLSGDLPHLLTSVYEHAPMCDVYLVIDGKEHINEQSKKNIIHPNPDYSPGIDLHEITLPYSVGKGGFYSHRTIAGFSHLVNTEFVSFIDQDNMIGKGHFESLIKKIDDNPDLLFSYSMRTIMDKDGTPICVDECESLGYIPILGNSGAGYLVDTSCWMYKTSFIKTAGHIWHNGWGADRNFTNVISNHFGNAVMKKASTKLPTLLYRLGGNPGSVQAEFFLTGNRRIKEV